jgi:hypothetical protein
MNVYLIQYGYCPLVGKATRGEVKIIANTEAEAREAFDAAYKTDQGWHGIFYVEALALSELF